MFDLSFKKFMDHVDKVILKASHGVMGVHDASDAPWRDLYDATQGEASDEDICETLEEYDDVFSAILHMDEE